MSKAIEIAIESGYRHIDCAIVYGNEKEVGVALAEAMKKYGVKREELFITTKVSISVILTYHNSSGVINMHLKM